MNGVTMERSAPSNANLVPGGKKDGSGSVGEADIMLTQNGGKSDQKVWIWEIKAQPQQIEVPDQLDRYIRKTTGGTTGWRLPTSPAIPNTKGGFIRAWSLSNADTDPAVGDGIRLYADAVGNKKNSNNKSSSQSHSSGAHLQPVCGLSLSGLGSCSPPSWVQGVNSWLGGLLGPEPPGVPVGEPGIPVPAL